MKKSTKLLLSVFAVFLTLMTAATLTFSIITMTKVNAAGEDQDASSLQEEPSEDNIVIGDNYTVLSTETISDAYLSGDSSKLTDDEKETLDLASAVLKDLIKDGMSDYEKETAVFTWMHENIHIDDGGMTLIRRSPEDVSTPLGVLKGKKAVCVGYATTFRLFMEMSEIPCMVVHDDSKVHSWDLVQIDGNWYHVDLYSADGLKSPYGYLNLPDEMMYKEWDVSLYPAADSYDYCYLYREADTLDDLYDIPSKLKAALEDHASYLSLLYRPDTEAEETAAEYMLDTLCQKLMSSKEYEDTYFNYSVSEAGDRLLITVMISDAGEEDDRTAPEGVDATAIDSAITKAFGELTDAYGDDTQIYVSDYSE